MYLFHTKFLNGVCVDSESGCQWCDYNAEFYKLLSFGLRVVNRDQVHRHNCTICLWTWSWTFGFHEPGNFL